MSNIKELIRQEIERRKKKRMNEDLPISIGRYYEDRDLLSFIDSLPDENNPEPYNPVYDEDYLNEKIAKATKSWEGVDVDKMLAECRGIEEPSDDLEEEINRYFYPLHPSDIQFEPFTQMEKCARHFAEWQKEQDARDMYMSDNRHFQKIYELGKKDMKEQMMKEAVEGEITVGRLPDDWSLAYNPDELHKALLKFKSGDKVKIIIVKEDD